jgi:hypothetical protein
MSIEINGMVHVILTNAAATRGPAPSLPACPFAYGVDRCAALLKEMDATIVRGPMEGSWAPGYYYVLFEDPDGIRLEVNFVPGAGPGTSADGRGYRLAPTRRVMVDPLTGNVTLTPS